MRRNQRRILTAVLAMLLSIGSWFAMHAGRSEPAAERPQVRDWQLRDWYSLESCGSTANCEIAVGHRIRLVLGCLSDDATQDHFVTLRLSPIQTRSRIDNAPATRVQPLAQPGSVPVNQKTELKVSSTTHAGARRPFVASREFFLHVTDGRLDDPKQYARITASNLACGSRVRIFVDRQLAPGEVSQSRVEDLLRLFEVEVLPRVESQFGPLSDVDGDGSLTVVLTPWLSRLQGGRTSIGGMVRSSDFQRTIAPPMSNCCDVLFLNSNLPSDAALRDLVSHEVAHVACISQRLSRDTGLLRDEDDWLSEALAHLAEPGGSNLDHRIAAFLDNPSQFPLVVPDYYRAGLWRNPGCRGATYLFTRWCIGRRDPEFVHELAQSTRRGTRNLERATGHRFEDLFRAWTISLANGDELDAADSRSSLRRLSPMRLQPVECPAGRDELTLQVRGTAFTVVDLPMNESPRSLRIAGDSAAKWQFSICRWPDDSGGFPESSTLAANKH